MRRRALVIGLTICVPVIVAAVIWLANSPALLYRLTGRVHYFNAAVSREVPKGSDVSHLEAVVGSGKRVEAPPWLLQNMEREPELYPDGWREGDEFIRYECSGPPGHCTLNFQVRNGKLVNYDPVVLASQPQEHLSGSAPGPATQ